MKRIACPALLLTLAALALGGCGGGSSSNSTAATPAVTGVATPQSVSVVTAN